MGCTKIKETCGDKLYATCVYYELPLPEISELVGCVTIEDTTEELYSLVEELKQELDFSEVTTDCGDLTAQTIKQIIVAQQNKICELETQLEQVSSNQNICNIPIADCNLNLQGLVDACGEQPTTVGDLLQIIINQITP